MQYKQVGDPKEIDTYILEGERSDSIALYDHKAFLFSKEKNLLIIPASYEEINPKIIDYDYDVKIGDEEKFVKELISPKYFRGAAVFYIDKSGFRLRGKISHSDGSSEDSYWGGGYGGAGSVKRSLYIEDVLYTLSDKYLKMNKLNGLKDMSSLTLSNTEEPAPPPIWGDPEPMPMPVMPRSNSVK